MKIGIVTINDNNNYGNRLQNYAIQEVLKSLNCESVTLKNIPQLNGKDKILLKFAKYLISKKKLNSQRLNYFINFNENITFSKKYVTPYSKISNKYDYFITGSDQVWNSRLGGLREVDLLDFCKNEQKISFSASFGVNEIPENKRDFVKSKLQTFKAISVREHTGKDIVKELTNRTDVEVLVDPTMLLSAEEWDKVAKRPYQLNSLFSDKYILNYFLGELPREWKEEIERIAQQNNCEIINILDKNSPFYQTGPSEFLYLEKHAFLVCTDSFHSSVFAIIYDTPFVVFNRQEKGLASMTSRIDTLLTTFKLENRRFKDKITNDLLKSDYMQANEILENQKEKSIEFLKNALDIK